MADNVQFTPGAGAFGATDDIGGIHYPRVKIALGADGTAVDAVAGAGAVGTGVQRTTLASDDPAVASLATIAGTVTTSRSAVNLISGQSGVAAGAGAVGATVQRVTLASDDPGVASLATLAGTVSSARSAVNPISGQAGVAAGAGAVGATVQRVTLASDDPGVAKLNTINTAVVATARATEGDYETVAASQTAQALGATGATGDFISHLLVVPASTSPGNVLLLDNATSITVFTGGASSVTNLVPFIIPLNMISVSGAWKVTTGASVSVIGVGSFT